MSAAADIARVLEGARRRQVRVVLLAGLAAGVGAALVCLLLGAIALATGSRTGFRVVALAGAAAAGVAAVIGVVRALLRSARDSAAAARTVAGEEAGLRSALLSSVELGRAREEIAASGQLSVALVDAHLARTADEAQKIDLRRAIPDRPARLSGYALLGVLGLYAVAFLAGGAALGRAYGRVLAGDPPGAPRAQVDPITGDIEITYAYPAYMRRDSRTLSGTGGELRAPKGTDVTLRARADRPVQAAEIALQYEVAPPGPGPAAAPTPAPSATPAPSGPGASSGPAAPSGPAAAAAAPVVKRFALSVQDERDLTARFVIEEGGSYRFRFLDGKGRLLVEGPAIPITLEPDAPPQVRITAPGRSVEVSPDEVVGVTWEAEDDFGLSEVALVVKPPEGAEQRRVLRRADGQTLRRDGGTADLPLAKLGLGEGEEVRYWLEAADTDTVSGPKRSRSDVHTVKIYSEAEHRRQVLEQAKQLFERLVALLGDRLDTFSAGPVTAPDRFPSVQALDTRTRQLHEAMRATAQDLRKDPAGPREVAAALLNVAAGLRAAEQRVTAFRIAIGQNLRTKLRPEGALGRAMATADDTLDRELEKGILYLEQLLDKRRAEDLVKLAKDLQKRRRELGGLLEKYRAAPTEQGKKELLAQISRLKERVRDLLQRMSELSKGFNDEHMNEEALKELARSQDLQANLDEVEQKLARGDVEGAMKALDQMANLMDRMMAGLERNAGAPDERARALMKDMLAFKDALEKVQAEQRRTAEETDQIRGEYRKHIAERLKNADKALKELAQKAKEAREDVDRAQPGVSYRAEGEYEVAREATRDLERALAMRELEGAAEAALRAQPSVDRLSTALQEDAQLDDRTGALTGRDPAKIDDARRHADRAAPKVRQIREALSRLLPDPRQVLSPEQQKRLEQLARRQDQLERQAGQLQRQLSELAQKAPVFPPSAMGALSESRGHMGQAAAELGARNPQRGHGEQELALDALERMKKGLEQAGRQRGGGRPGGGFPYPFADSSGQQMGEGIEPSREPVKIPGAEAHKVPEEFRRDLLEAMRQGAPERYRGEVQRYYEELVK